MLDVAFDVIKAWGFKFKTVGFYWVKENIRSQGFFTGLGYYTRANPEQCLLATRGAGLKRKDRSVKRLIVAPRGRHSEKPLEAHAELSDFLVTSLGSNYLPVAGAWVGMHLVIKLKDLYTFQPD